MILKFPDVCIKNSDQSVLRLADYSESCRHNKFVVDATLDTVQCGICGKSLNPMWVLAELCGHEHRAAHRLRELEGMAEKISGKLRCKCEHCKKMTTIHRF